MLEILISLILRSEISHDEWINVVYLFCSDLLFFCFPKNSQKLFKMPTTSNMADINWCTEYQHKNFAREKCKSNFDLLLFAYLYGRHWQII